MPGRFIVIGLVVACTLFGVALWWFQTRAYYTEITAQSVMIQGVSYQAGDYRGIDAQSSPLKLRACFTLSSEPDAPLAPAPTPLIAPDWFDCFDAERLEQDIAQGRAIAYLAQANDQDGVDRIIARYPDGRAFEWRQLNAKYAQ